MKIIEIYQNNNETIALDEKGNTYLLVSKNNPSTGYLETYWKLLEIK
jgi:hypothetical protein